MRCEEKDMLCYFLRELFKELKSISVAWRERVVDQDTWGNYQRILFQIDVLLGPESLVDTAAAEKEITSFRRKHRKLVDFVKGKVRGSPAEEDFFEGVCESIEFLVQKLISPDGGQGTRL